MHRTLPLLALLLSTAGTAQAWTFSPDPICTIADTQDDVSIEVTYDPGEALYAFHVIRPEGWPDAPSLTVEFARDTGVLQISTSRHVVDGAQLTVVDRRFGNVLRGLEEFDRAIIRMNQTDIARLDTTGASPAVAEFRACPATPSV